jgi:hypothetical protein
VTLFPKLAISSKATRALTRRGYVKRIFLAALLSCFCYAI